MRRRATESGPTLCRGVGGNLELKRRTSKGSRIWAARAVGAGAVAALGQFAVDMPGGYFGAADEITPFGTTYSVVLAATVTAALLGHLWERRWATPLTFVLLSANLAAFLAPLPADPLVAGAVALWHVLLLGQLVFRAEYPSRQSSRRAQDGEAQLDDWLALNRHAVQHLLTVAVAVTVAAVGFRIGSRAPALTVCGLVHVAALGAVARYSWLTWRTGRRGALLFLVPLIGALASVTHPAQLLGWLGVLQAAALLTLLSHSAVAADLLEFFFHRPALLLAASFALIIALGTLLLSFPAAAAGQPISPVDALFTSTSASCVTGLIVLDTAADFTTFGQSVILGLIQVGGLNIMVLSSFAALLLGSGIGLRGERVLGELLDARTARTAVHLTAFIVATTVAVEATGAVALAPLFRSHGMSWHEAIWRGAFHSISAFCNAGFALQGDNLALFARQPLALIVFAILITLGGLGFATLAAGWGWLRGRRWTAPPIQVRVVLLASLALVAVATTWVAVSEWERSLAGMSVADRLANAFFQAVTPRTAGFNTIDMGLLHPSTVLLLMALMFVGAAPGGTGGGIKVTTIAVLAGAVRAISRGESRVVLFRRTVPLETVFRSAAIAGIALALAFLGTVALLATEGVGLQVAGFEILSALGTVGLSLGLTPALSTSGKLIVVAVMFAGRIGPLALALVLSRAGASRLGYPESRIMVG